LSYSVGHVRGDFLDIILVLLAAAFAVGGYRQGFIVGALGCAGFLVGAAVGIICAPQIARFVAHDPGQRALVAVIMVFLTAMAGQLLASMAGMAVRSRVTGHPATLADALGGAGVSVMSVLLIAAFLGSAVASVPFSPVSSQVSRSVVLRGLGWFMPSFADVQHFLDGSPYLPLFGTLAAGSALSAPPSQRVLGSPALARERQSIVKVMGMACGQSRSGTGFVFAPHHVLTNAHVVAGVRGGLRVSNGWPNSASAQVVLFDPRRDIAVLYVPGLNAPPLGLIRHVQAGSSAIVAGYPDSLPLTTVPARVSSPLAVTISDIYSVAVVTREVYVVRAMVRPGNSGGPLLAPGGSVYGVVFAASVNEPGYGAALTIGEVMPDASAGAAATAPVATQQCAA
jgi:S1-C subfamily serine protease